MTMQPMQQNLENRLTEYMSLCRSYAYTLLHFRLFYCGSGLGDDGSERADADCRQRAPQYPTARCGILGRSRVLVHIDSRTVVMEVEIR